MGQQIDLVVAADRQPLAEVALRNTLRDAPDFLQTPHLPHAEHQAAHDARAKTEQPAAHQRLDDRRADAQDVREVSPQHQHVAVRTPLRHRADDRRYLVSRDRHRVIERHAAAVRLQAGGQRQHIAGDMRAVRGKEPVVVGMHPLVLDPVQDRGGKLAVLDRIEVDHLPIDHGVGFPLHVVRDHRCDETEQQHDRHGERHGIDRHQPKRTRVPASRGCRRDVMRGRRHGSRLSQGDTLRRVRSGSSASHRMDRSSCATGPCALRSGSCRDRSDSPIRPRTTSSA